MILKKQIIDQIDQCYSVSSFQVNGETRLVFAAEGDGFCQIYSGDKLETKNVVWQGGGGTMSLVPVDDKEGYFFASKGFYTMADSTGSSVYLLHNIDGSYIEQKIIDIPYLHRFDVITVGRKRYFIGASLCSAKKDIDDWSSPGKIFVAEIPYDLPQGMNIKLTVLKEGLTKNHGYSRGKWDGVDAGFISAEEGLFAVMPPSEKNAEWSIEQILYHPISDATILDIDGDDEQEIAVIEPFHGNKFAIYKEIDGKYEEVYTYPVEMGFYHAICQGLIEGAPTVVVGARTGIQQLFLVQYNQDSGKYRAMVIDDHVGSSNAQIIQTKKGTQIISANRQIGEAAVYHIK